MWLGINPNLSGRIALLTAAGTVEEWDVPTVRIPAPRRGAKARTELDRTAIRALANGWGQRRGSGRVAIETQGIIPQNGSIAAFRGGFGYGVWLTALEAAGFVPHEVAAVVWKKAMGVLPPREAETWPKPKGDPVAIAAWRAARPPEGIKGYNRAVRAWKRAKPQPPAAEAGAAKSAQKQRNDRRRVAGFELMRARCGELLPGIVLEDGQAAHNRAAALLLAIYAARLDGVTFGSAPGFVAPGFAQGPVVDLPAGALFDNPNGG